MATKKTSTSVRKTTRTRVQAPMIVKPPSPAAPVAKVTSAPTHEQIARRAFEIFAGRGYTHGRDQQDWLQAERELRGE